MWTRRIAVAALVLVASIDSYREDPYKVLGVKHSASDAEIKRAYRLLALKWHPDKNRDDPKAEQQFMRIGAAYEQLTNTPVPVEPARQYRKGKQRYRDFGQRYANGYGYSNQPQYSTWYWDLSYLTTPFLLMILVAVVMGMLGIKGSEAKTQPTESSSLQQLAKVFAPSIYELRPLYLTARGRRTLVFLPDDMRHGCSVRDQLSIIEKLATEFQRDPLTFCWLDLNAQSLDKRALWQQQFGTNQVAPFVVSLSNKGSKLSLFQSCDDSSKDRLALEDEVRTWLLRLLGGEIPQIPSKPGLFE